jgi:hypothetical protein
MEVYKSYVISVKPGLIEDKMSHNSKSIKYKLRRDEVINNLIPSFDKICKVEIFDAITPDDFVVEEDKIYYKEHILKRGLDKNRGIYSDNFQVSLTLGYYEIFKKSIEEKFSVLLLEDDAVLPEKNINNVKSSIEEFMKIKEPSMLYLQSECPWKKNYPIRKISNNFLIEYSEVLNKIRFDWHDIFGTTCFVLNKDGVLRMMQVINEFGIKNIDQLTTIAMNNKLIDVYISKDNENMILLNKKLQ